MPVRGRSAGNKGQGSKWITRKRRLAIYARDGYACVWCTRGVGLHAAWCKQVGGLLATLDHVVPREHGGCNTNHNLITACMECNRKRGSLDAIAFANLIATTSNPGCTIAARVLRAITTRIL